MAEIELVQRWILSTLRLAERPLRLSEVIKWLSGVERREVEEAARRLLDAGRVCISLDWHIIITEPTNG
jgi:hypothetical protein